MGGCAFIWVRCHPLWGLGGLFKMTIFFLSKVLQLALCSPLLSSLLFCPAIPPFSPVLLTLTPVPSGRGVRQTIPPALA